MNMGGFEKGADSIIKESYYIAAAGLVPKSYQMLPLGLLRRAG